MELNTILYSTLFERKVGYKIIILVKRSGTYEFMQFKTEFNVVETYCLVMVFWTTAVGRIFEDSFREAQ